MADYIIDYSHTYGLPASATRMMTMSMLLFYVVLAVVCAVGIPVFVKGMIRITKGMNAFAKAGLDTRELVKAKKKIIVFFVLSLALPFGILTGVFPAAACFIIACVFVAVSILFMILMIGTKSSACTLIEARKKECLGYIPPKENIRMTPSGTAGYGSDNYMKQAEEIAKFKELLDSGAITQEEFEAKKKEILR